MASAIGATPTSTNAGSTHSPSGSSRRVSSSAARRAASERAARRRSSASERSRTDAGTPAARAKPSTASTSSPGGSSPVSAQADLDQPAGAIDGGAARERDGEQLEHEARRRIEVARRADQSPVPAHRDDDQDAARRHADRARHRETAPMTSKPSSHAQRETDPGQCEHDAARRRRPGERDLDLPRRLREPAEHLGGTGERRGQRCARLRRDPPGRGERRPGRALGRIRRTVRPRPAVLAARALTRLRHAHRSGRRPSAVAYRHAGSAGMPAPVSTASRSTSTATGSNESGRTTSPRPRCRRAQKHGRPTAETVERPASDAPGKARSGGRCPRRACARSRPPWPRGSARRR